MPSLAPMLSLRRGKEAIAFCVAAFGAVEVQRMESPEGEVVACLRIGECELWLADESPAHKNFSPESLGGSTVRMILTVDDPDTLFAQAVAAGATIVSPMQDHDYGWRVGRVSDPFGHHWEIGKPLS